MMEKSANKENEDGGDANGKVEIDDESATDSTEGGTYR